MGQYIIWLGLRFSDMDHLSYAQDRYIGSQCVFRVSVERKRQDSPSSLKLVDTCTIRASMMQLLFPGTESAESDMFFFSAATTKLEAVIPESKYNVMQ